MFRIDGEVDWDKVNEVALAILSLTMDKNGMAWKGMDWGVMNDLHDLGYISNPRTKAKSVWFTPEGEEKAKEIIESYFCKDPSELTDP